MCSLLYILLNCSLFR
uniref:Uncharacterized protein n=1 Tax=Rhizophora mucronata TaxID=61149 RepID=A0A2P2ILH7_RHIMU